MARCFMETKAYENPCWREFLESTRSTLLRTPEESWDEQWLRDLHLFNVVVRDANQCSEHAPAISGNIDLADFYRALVSKQQNSLSTLLSSYASQDAAAAFRLADVCGMDLASEFPQVVISNCDQTPFFSLVVRRALNDQPRLELWSALLAEAALRSRAVASTMDKMPANDELRIAIAKIAPKERWFASPLVSCTFYTQVLTLAMSSDMKVKAPYRLLVLLRHAAAPGSLGWRRYAYGYLSILPSAILLGLMLPAFFSLLSGTVPSQLSLWCIFPFFVLNLYAMSRHMSVTPFYKSVLNLQSVSRPRSSGWKAIIPYLGGERYTISERMIMAGMAEARETVKPDISAST